jgi:acyl phosphate:glycerol-3-phosphate acyltransferase
MSAPLQTTLLVLLAYLLGSLPFAVIVSKLYGLEDPRSHGSGNPGATNVLRTGNKSAALLTLLGDAAKGWLAVWLAGRLGGSALDVAVAGVAAFIGHVYPVFLKFRGGKGVATALGVLAGWSWILALIAIVAWVVTVSLTRYSSLSALVAAMAAPIGAGFLNVSIYLMTAVTVMSGLLIWRHRANIQRLLAGTESRIGSRKQDA